LRIGTSLEISELYGFEFGEDKIHPCFAPLPCLRWSSYFATILLGKAQSQRRENNDLFSLVSYIQVKIDCQFLLLYEIGESRYLHSVFREINGRLCYPIHKYYNHVVEIYLNGS
jgi:hypothetical protein